MRLSVAPVSARAALNAVHPTPRVCPAISINGRRLTLAARPARPARAIAPAAGNRLSPSNVHRGSLVSSRLQSTAAPLAKTPLYDLHVEHKAKMVPFAGFSMPLNYADQSHVESHHWTRTNASLFDVSHMVQHHIIGPGALDLLMKVTPSSLDALKDGHSTLSCLLDPTTGGILDDTVITRLGPESFYFVTNAARRTEDLAFLAGEIEAFRATHDPAARSSVIHWNVLDTRALVALQGPAAAAALQPLVTANEPSVDADLSTLYFGSCRSLNLTFPDGTHTAHRLLVSRTGYTGEDGFEISIPVDADLDLPTKVVSLLLSNPAVRLAGLAARDSLRLEAGMCLYGHDITPAHTPPAAALGWLVGKTRREPGTPAACFNGADIILPQIAKPGKTLTTRRVGLIVEAGPPAREGAVLVDLARGPDSPEAAAADSGASADTAGYVPIGAVTSGLPSPTLGGTNVAMGYVANGLHRKGTEVGVVVRRRLRRATVAGMPFVPSKFYRG